MRVTSRRNAVMANWSQQATKVCISSGLSVSPASAAGVPPAWAQGFSDIVKKTTPAVVNIAVTGGGEGSRRRGGAPPSPFGTPPPGDEPEGGEGPTPPPIPHGPPMPHRPDQSAGSGVILDASGFIVTNNHVVEGATQITAQIRRLIWRSSRSTPRTCRR
jgi:serine protease Do